MRLVEILATGHSWSGGGGPIMWTPLAGLFLTVVLIRSALRLRLSPVMIGISVILGTLFAIGAESWGLTMAISAWLLGALIVSGGRRHTPGPSGRNLPD